MGLAVDKDHLVDAERNHGIETVDYAAISSQGVCPLLEINC
jgi:hypothetical protein